MSSSSEDAVVSSQLQGDAQERIIYRYSPLRLIFGEVLVTDRRLVLGKRTWPIESIQDAKLVPEQVVGGIMQINSNTMAGFANGTILAGSALLLIRFAPQGGMQILFILAAMLLFGLSAVIFVRLAIKNPNTIYKMKLTLASSESYWQYEAPYIWIDKWHAEKALRAVHEAIKIRSQA